MKISYSNKSIAKTGTPLYPREINDILELCKNMKKSGQKHQDGSIYPMLKDSVGHASAEYAEELYYDGLLFVDIDHIPLKVAETIFNEFEKLYEKYPFFYAIQYSSSYYLRPESDDVGLHVYVCGPNGNGKDYHKYSLFAMAVTSELILKEFGFDLKGMEGKVLDTSICSISHRFFLYHSDYRLNPYPMFFNNELYEKNVDKLKDKYNWFDKVDDDIETYKSISCNIIGKVEHKVQLTYTNEYPICNFLAAMGWNTDQIVKALLMIDARNDDEQYFKDHQFSRIRHFRQLADAAKGRGVNDREKKIATDILRRCGLYIQEEVENLITDEILEEYSL